MAEREDLKRLLKDIPYVQKMFLAMLTDASEKRSDRDALFLSKPFREALASNLFFVFTSSVEYDSESGTERENVKFLSSYIWTLIQTTPVNLLVSLVLVNIEFNHEVDLSDYHKAFGRGLSAGGRKKNGTRLVLFNKPAGEFPS